MILYRTFFFGVPFYRSIFLVAWNWFFIQSKNIFPPLTSHKTRALLDITSGPEVRQIFKVQAVRKPDILLPRPPISHNNNCRKKLQKIIYFLLTPICVQWPYLMRIDNLYLVGKMFKNVSLDSVRSGKFGCPVLSGQETHMLSPVEPYIKPLKPMPSHFCHLSV